MAKIKNLKVRGVNKERGKITCAERKNLRNERLANPPRNCVVCMGFSENAFRVYFAVPNAL